MKKILNYSVVLFVLTIILLLIIPLPAGMVDVAIILNMALSMMILVSTMTIREPPGTFNFSIPSSGNHSFQAWHQCFYNPEHSFQWRFLRPDYKSLW